MDMEGSSMSSFDGHLRDLKRATHRQEASVSGRVITSSGDRADKEINDSLVVLLGMDDS